MGFSCAMLSGVSWSILHWVLPVQCCPKSITTTLNRVFSCRMLSGATWTTLHKVFFQQNVVLTALRQHWTGCFPVQCCLERLRQHCLRFLPVQCCPNRIKTTLKRIFSCPKSIKATLKNNFSCAMMSESLGKRYTRYLFTYAKLAHV